MDNDPRTPPPKVTKPGTAATVREVRVRYLTKTREVRTPFTVERRP